MEVVGNSIGAGACANIKRDSSLFCIKDDTKFLHFLSDTENEGEGNDWLYIVIADMVCSTLLYACWHNKNVKS